MENGIRFEDIPLGVPYFSRANEAQIVRIDGETYGLGADLCIEIGRGTIHHANEYHGSSDWMPAQ